MEDAIRFYGNFIFEDYNLSLCNLNLVDKKFVVANIVHKDELKFNYFLRKINLYENYEEGDMLTLFYNWLDNDFFISSSKGNIVPIIDVCGTFHSELNKLVELETSFVTAEEYLVSSRGISEFTLENFNLINDTYNLIVKENKNIISGILNCDPQLFINLGIYHDMEEYYKDLYNMKNEEPAYVEVHYNYKTQFTKLLFGRKNSNNECCFNIFDENIINRIRNMIESQMKYQFGTNYTNKIFGHLEEIKNLYSSIENHESIIRQCKDRLRYLGENID